MLSESTPAIFEVRVVHAEDGRVETGSYDILPQQEQAAKVCGLFREFLAGQPAEFRERVPFLKRGDVELDWSAAPGGVAFATFLENGEALTLGVLASRTNAEADEGILEGFEQEVLTPLLGEVPAGVRGQLFAAGSPHPLLMTVVLPGHAELLPMLNLLNASLAAVYFETVRRLHGGELQ
jgi:hypothetical protein